MYTTAPLSRPQNRTLLITHHWPSEFRRNYFIVSSLGDERVIRNLVPVELRLQQKSGSINEELLSIDATRRIARTWADVT